ncbi:MAG: TetR/AcrR family transcriptional regulator [Myxococcales bacterium]|nr:TetR/AcrR family transcriptional regulator [Myxococcales bacterium]
MPRPRFDQLPAPKRRRILDAAAEEFAQHGFDGASYNRIIRAAGVSKGAMYYYFDDKQDLFLTTVEDTLARGQEAFGSLDSVLAATDARGFWDAMQGLNRRAWSIFYDDPSLLALGKALLASPGLTESATYRELVARLDGVMRELVAAGVEVGAIRRDLDPALLSAVLLGMGEALDRFLIARVDTLDPAALAGLPERVLDLFVRAAAPAHALSSLVLGARDEPRAAPSDVSDQPLADAPAEAPAEAPAPEE